MLITNVQLARAIVKSVGEFYQFEVAEYLRGYSWSNLEKYKASKIMSNIESEYVLNAANVLVKEKYEELPRYIKDWIESQ